jgi:hypothetical protein
MLIPVASATTNMEREPQTPASFSEFTHTVIVEYGTLTTCGPCVTASGQLNSIYQSGDLDFNFVTLVWDEGNRNVRNRLQELGVSSVPDVYFDGGYRRLLGAQVDETPYRNAITQSGERDVPDVNADLSVQWIGGGALKLSLTVENNEPETFSGHIRIYITEKESRWNDNGGNPYHFAVLDIPVDRNLAVAPQGPITQHADTYTINKLWLGFLYGFGDITEENILVIASIFDQDTGYAVETTSAEPAASGTMLPFNGHAFTILSRFISDHPRIATFFSTI